MDICQCASIDAVTLLENKHSTVRQTRQGGEGFGHGASKCVVAKVDPYQLRQEGQLVRNGTGHSEIGQVERPKQWERKPI